MSVYNVTHNIQLVTMEVRCDICEEADATKSTFWEPHVAQLLNQLRTPGIYLLNVTVMRDNVLYPAVQKKGPHLIDLAVKNGWRYETRYGRPWCVCPTCIAREDDLQGTKHPLLNVAG